MAVEPKRRTAVQREGEGSREVSMGKTRKRRHGSVEGGLGFDRGSKENSKLVVVMDTHEGSTVAGASSGRWLWVLGENLSAQKRAREERLIRVLKPQCV
ncbi:hypothetical protein GQ457_10G008470 [Hibiscus cannabinus]